MLTPELGKEQEELYAWKSERKLYPSAAELDAWKFPSWQPRYMRRSETVDEYDYAPLKEIVDEVVRRLAHYKRPEQPAASESTDSFAPTFIDHGPESEWTEASTTSTSSTVSELAKRFGGAQLQLQSRIFDGHGAVSSLCGRSKGGIVAMRKQCSNISRHWHIGQRTDDPYEPLSNVEPSRPTTVPVTAMVQRRYPLCN